MAVDLETISNHFLLNYMRSGCKLVLDVVCKGKIALRVADGESLHWRVQKCRVNLNAVLPGGNILRKSKTLQSRDWN